MFVLIEPTAGARRTAQRCSCSLRRAAVAGAKKQARDAVFSAPRVV